jgi:hypothetical protein
MVATARRTDSVALGLGRVVLTAAMLSSAMGAVLLIINMRDADGLASVGAAACLAAGATAMAVAIRLAASRLGSHFPDWELRAILLGPTCVLLALAVSVIGKETPLGAVVLIWAAFAAEEIWWWLRGGQNPTDSAASRTSPSVRSPTMAPGVGGPQADLGEVGGDLAGELSGESLPLGLVQHMTRRIDGDRETVVCLMRATFEPGQRQASLHASFCPPLEADPLCECEQVEGPEAAIKLTQAESFGARVELRLPRRPETGVSVVIRITANSTPLA